MKNLKDTTKKYNATLIAVASTALFLFPIYWMFITSIKPRNELFSNPPTLYPLNPTFHAYKENFLNDLQIIGYIGNSVIIATGTLLLTLLLAAPFAYALARVNIKGKGILLIFLLSTQMLPNIMLAMPLFIMFSKYGLINSFTALIIANTTYALPFAILVLRPYFLSIPSGLEEAAAIDGCNKLRTFWKIILPLVRPGLLTVGAFCFLFGWGDLLFALILTSDPSLRPLTLGLYNFIGEYGTNWNSLMAVAAIATIPIIVIFITLQKYIVGGLTSGSVK
jgi:multiple sugar transport system permease protein